jgi:very-short-patch-repair endonuclease
MFFRKADKQKRVALRHNMTKAEKYLWQELRKKARAGYRFRRQFSIGGFVVDFYCMELKLAVEVDGEYHKYNKEYDLAREQAIRKIGIDFIRFSNDEVIKNWEVVNLKIEKKLLALSSLRDGGAARRAEGA